MDWMSNGGGVGWLTDPTRFRLMEPEPDMIGCAYADGRGPARLPLLD